MSFSIDSRYITGIYALGQWFSVKSDTLEIDSFILTQWRDKSPLRGDPTLAPYSDYAMGDIYPDDQDAHTFSHDGDGFQGGLHSPRGVDGVSFIDADTGERVSFSLMEVRAFREVRP